MPRGEIACRLQFFLQTLLGATPQSFVPYAPQLNVLRSARQCQPPFSLNRAYGPLCVLPLYHVAEYPLPPPSMPCEAVALFFKPHFTLARIAPYFPASPNFVELPLRHSDAASNVSV